MKSTRFFQAGAGFAGGLTYIQSMRPRHRLTPARLFAAATATLLATGFAAGTASAEPAPVPGTPTALAAAIARDLKLTPEQFTQRAELAQRLASFADTIRANFPTSFAGAWLDVKGGAVVSLAPSPAKSAAAEAVKKAGFAVAEAGKSEQTLRGELTAFQGWLAGQPPAVSKAIRGAVIDTRANTVAVQVDRGGPALPLPGFAKALPIGPIKFGNPAASPVAATPQGALGGGDGYASGNPPRALLCSFGFNGTDKGGQVVNITAGHCNPNLAAPTPIFEVRGGGFGMPLGNFAKSVLDTRDYSIVRVADNVRSRFENNQVHAAGQAPIAITGTGVPVAGAPVCKSGTRTGFSCGTVTAVNQTVDVESRKLTGSFATNLCALPGDSGGAVISGNRALGISSASSVADFPFCEIPVFLGMLTGEGPQLFVQPINDVLAQNPGLKIRTA